MSSIVVESSLDQITGGFYSLRLKTTGDDMPSAVFAIEVLPTSRDPKAVPYRFSHICKLPDLLELPDTQDPNLAYFRTDDVEMIFDTLNLAIETRRIIQHDINKLVVAYNNMNDPTVTG